MELSDKGTEENVLALIMNAKSRETVSDVFAKIDPDLFFFEPHRKLYNLLFDCYMKGEETTYFSVRNKHQKQLDDIAQELEDSIITIGLGFNNIDYANEYLEQSEDVIGILADRLKAKKKMRDLHEIQIRIANGLEQEESPDSTYEAIENLLLKNHSSSANRSYLSPKEMALMMVNSAADRMDKQKRENEIIYTSYEKFNKKSGGLEKGNLIIISAESGVGKSALALNLIRDVSFIGGKSSVYLNSEMTDSQQARRYDALLCKVSHKAIRSGEISMEEYNNILKVADSFAGKQIHTITIPDMQLPQVLAELKRMKAKANIDFAVVDYIGRMDFSKNKKDLSEWQLMEQSARELKNIALELDIVVVMVAQMSSNGQTLAKGSSMKNECDLWINIKRVEESDYKEYFDNNGVGLDKWWNVLLDFKKARSAEFGSKIPMHFYGDELLFTDNEEEAKHFMYLEKKQGEYVNGRGAEKG